MKNSAGVCVMKAWSVRNRLKHKYFHVTFQLKQPGTYSSCSPQCHSFQWRRCPNTLVGRLQSEQTLRSKQQRNVWIIRVFSCEWNMNQSHCLVSFATPVDLSTVTGRREIDQTRFSSRNENCMRNQIFVTLQYPKHRLLRSFAAAIEKLLTAC